jgi:hypothetical protein
LRGFPQARQQPRHIFQFIGFRHSNCASAHVESLLYERINGGVGSREGVARRVREESKLQMVSMQLPRGSTGAAKGALLHARRLAPISTLYSCQIRGVGPRSRYPFVMKLSYESRCILGPCGCSRWNLRNTRSPSPRLGWVLGVPRLHLDRRRGQLHDPSLTYDALAPIVSNRMRSGRA